MVSLEDKLKHLVSAIESAKRQDRTSNYYYIAGTPELSRALREAKLLLHRLEQKDGNVAAIP